MRVGPDWIPGSESTGPGASPDGGPRTREQISNAHGDIKRETPLGRRRLIGANLAASATARAVFAVPGSADEKTGMALRAYPAGGDPMR